MTKPTVLLILGSILLSLGGLLENHCGDLHQAVGLNNATTPSRHDYQNPKRRRRVDIQLAITGSVTIPINAMRLLTTSINGWHQDFEDVQIYTFDPVHEKSPFSNVITTVKPLFETEKTKRDNNLLLAAIKNAYYHNPNADWYFLAEDDSIVFKDNLLHAIQEWNLNSSDYVMAGKSITMGNMGDDYGLPKHIKTIPFVMGGAGTLLSHALTKALAPRIDTCRVKYNNVYWGDARIGACLMGELNMTESDVQDIQPKSISRLFKGGNEIKDIKRFGSHDTDQEDRPICFHEKVPELIQVIQEWMQESKKTNRTMTWKAMKESGLHIALNKTIHQLMDSGR